MKAILKKVFLKLPAKAIKLFASRRNKKKAFKDRRRKLKNNNIGIRCPPSLKLRRVKREMNLKNTNRMRNRMIYSTKNYKYDSMNGTGHCYAALITTLIHCSTNRRPLCGHIGNFIPVCCINQFIESLPLENKPHSGDLFVARGNISDQIKPRSGDLNF